MFLLGFIADPIINIYLDPYGSLSPLSGSRTVYYEDESSSWLEHFIKGFAGLGLLSFLKVVLTSPWQWFNLRHSGIVGGTARGGTTGRDRMANISWLVVLIGVGTFLFVGDLRIPQIHVTDLLPRLCGRACVLGAAVLWRKQVSGLWTCRGMTATMTKKNMCRTALPLPLIASECHCVEKDNKRCCKCGITYQNTIFSYFCTRNV